MCAIMGFSKKTYTKEELLPFFDRTRSRGPDMSQILETPSGWLCFHRLAIMGLTEAGMQPFELDGDYVVCNGEIYGFRPLKRQLTEKGYSFRSGSDCEILLPLYREYGLEMFAKLDAEFALIIYDSKRDDLIAARDPIGIRPLYYGYDRSGAIVFASEPKNLVGLCKGIRPFPPGHYYADGKFVRYADLTTVTQYSPDDLETVCRNIRNKLIEKGVPPEEIAFIHEANTELRKAELFGKVRSGQVRFLLGSTQKMGAGTNVQDRLIALHHLDVPWRPSDIEQQEGRILRQGNLNPKVKIFRYVTEGTFDSYSWQLIENKQKFIGQIMTSKSPVRSCEDVDEAALTYAEVKALATGNPYIKEKMDLDIQVSKLKLMKANHTSQKYRLEDNIAKHYPQQITILKERISGMQADIQTAKANLPVDKEQFSMKVGDTLYTDKKEAGTALVEMCKEIKTVNAPAVIGEYAGFKMTLSFDAFNHKFVMNLKGQLSHNLEVGSDPLGNISRINHALESMPKQLMEAQTKLETVEHQLETAKVEVTKPFAQEAELAEKLERLSALNALLNMDEKGNDGIDMDDEPEAPKSEKEVADRPAKNTPLAEKTVGIGQDKSIRQYADVPAERVSLKAKLEVMKAKVAGGDTEKPMPQKVKGKEETL